MKSEEGEEIMDDSFYIIFNAAHHPLKYKLPAEEFGTTWIQMIDTNTGSIEEPTNIYKAGEEIEVADRSVVVLIQPYS
jgi:isoamylase